ncbi:MAG TPA: CoA-acylating methylmalonate-semialdehyde dehydrogenase [Polyangiaceae bacterium]|nr:CoA-acylating methylmalonate-semialdehyde dehydrogenase [Polyangiaceae bacterium]
MHLSLSPPLPLSHELRDCKNLAGGVWRSSNRGRTLEVTSPYTGQVIGTVGLSDASDVDVAVLGARKAFPAWAATPIKERVLPLRRFHDLVTRYAADLANTVALESGKTPAEALAGIQRGLEVIDYALSLPNLDDGAALEVSRGVTCEARREPLGVVAGVTPFNFPAMVPMWMFPIAVTLGNTFVLKPSERVPLAACRLGELMTEAGYAPGVFSVVHGDRETVAALVDHPDVRAVGFVGSTPAARAVYLRATALGKRALCLGGAKNHLLVAPDADETLTVRGVVDSFTGCAGQRCMAGSVLVAIGDGARFVDAVVRAAGAIQLGPGMGALIDAPARDRIAKAIDRAESEGARVLLDGRKASPPTGYEGGHWIGPTVLDGLRPGMECVTAELFGPVLAVLRVDNLDEALALERATPYGNATSIFTSSGAAARYVAERATSGMIGVNVGVPVPRDPFSFGGTKESRFGQGDITGPGALDLWSQLKKITTRWAPSPDASWMS